MNLSKNLFGTILSTPIKTTPKYINTNFLSNPTFQNNFHYKTGADQFQNVRSTTILCVRKGNKVTIIGDGQATAGSMVVKSNVKKVKNFRQGTVITGFAGSTADCMSLLTQLEAKLDEFRGQLSRACVELAKEWRTDRILRKLNASIIVADKENVFEIDGQGNVIQPHDGIIAIGSGSDFAVAAARGLYEGEEFEAEEIAKKAMNIASDICIYTNKNFIIESIVNEEDTAAKE